jgi:DNA-binding SARP family transcriptional activator
MEFGLLGPLTVRSEGILVLVPQGNQRALLAVLLVNGGAVVSFDELAETLWGVAPPPSSRVTVQNYVKRLRKALGDGGAAITTHPHGYSISIDASELDVTLGSGDGQDADPAVGGEAAA